MVTATFDEPVQEANIVFELRDAGGTLVPATLSYDTAPNTATLTPTTVLNENTDYTATVVNAVDLAGNSMSTADSWSFTTGGTFVSMQRMGMTVVPGGGLDL